MADSLRQSYGITATEPQVALTGRYTIGQTATLLGMHRNSITRLYQTGQLQAINPTAKPIRFYGKTIRSYWANRTNN